MIRNLFLEADTIRYGVEEAIRMAALGAERTADRERADDLDAQRTRAAIRRSCERGNWESV